MEFNWTLFLWTGFNLVLLGGAIAGCVWLLKKLKGLVEDVGEIKRRLK